MTVIICVADEDGISFNNRRVSKDKIVRQRILDIVGERTLRMSPYSKKQFVDVDNVIASETYLDEAGEDDFVFVETDSLESYADKIKDMYVFRWNRRYPFDKTFDVNMEPFFLHVGTEYEGNSHDCITEEYYLRKENEE